MGATHAEEEKAKKRDRRHQGACCVDRSTIPEQDHTSNQQACNHHEFSQPENCQTPGMGKERNQVFGPAFAHGAETTIHAGANETSPMPEPYFLTRCFKELR